MKRRQFIGSSVKASAASLLFSSEIFNTSPLLERIGIQFFSLPKMLDSDMKGALSMLSKIGYKEVELYGPFTFSSTSAIEKWNDVTPYMGFKGSGYFGLTDVEMKKLLNMNGFSVPSIHTDPTHYRQEWVNSVRRRRSWEMAMWCSPLFRKEQKDAG